MVSQSQDKVGPGKSIQSALAALVLPASESHGAVS